jgi:hypothetical protein
MAAFIWNCYRRWSVSRELAVDKKLGIEQLYASGVPKRRIASVILASRLGLNLDSGWFAWQAKIGAENS